MPYSMKSQVCDVVAATQKWSVDKLFRVTDPARKDYGVSTNRSCNDHDSSNRKFLHDQHDRRWKVGIVSQSTAFARLKKAGIQWSKNNLFVAIAERNLTCDDQVKFLLRRCLERCMSAGQNVRHAHPHRIGGARLFTLKTQAGHIEMLRGLITLSVGYPCDLHGYGFSITRSGVERRTDA